MKSLLAIDPGASGALAWMDLKEEVAQVEKMPKGMTAQADCLRELAASHKDIVAFVEKTGTVRPSDAKPAAAKFARHCGHLEAMLYCFGMPTIQVAPSVWQKSLGSLPREKGKRKKRIKEVMARRFPALKVTLSTADALGILTYAMERRLRARSVE